MKQILALCSVLLALALPTSARASCDWSWFIGSGQTAYAVSVPGPFIIEFVVEREVNVYPMVAPGASISDMFEEPALAK